MNLGGMAPIPIMGSDGKWTSLVTSRKIRGGATLAKMKIHPFDLFPLLSHVVGKPDAYISFPVQASVIEFRQDTGLTTLS